MQENINKNDIDKDEYASMCKTFQTLKFTPRTYRIELVGENYYVVMGEITKYQYDFWIDPVNNPYLEDMARGDLADGAIPNVAMLFEDGIWWEYCDIASAYGNLLYGTNQRVYSDLLIYDENDNLIHEVKLDKNTISAHGIGLELETSCLLDDIPEDMCVFVANSSELDDYFEGEIDLTDEFDLTKIKLVYSNVDNFELITDVYYNDMRVLNSAGNHQIDDDEFYVYQA